MTNTDTQNAIQHLAVIMDGNGRWAKKRGLPRAMGHRAGVKSVKQLLASCEKHQIPYLTIFAFSSENWNRPESEVSTLMDIFIKTLTKEMDELHSNGIAVRFIGDISRFTSELRETMRAAEEQTQNNSKLHLNIAVNYGGRWDIANATKIIAEKVKSGELSVDEVDETLVSKYTQLASMPAPDLLIRTGGEKRISNFLIWQTAYCEFYFADSLWPAFGEKEFDEAVDCFSTRQRRYGKTPEQVNNDKKSKHA